MTSAIVNQGTAAWAFAEQAERLADALWLNIASEPADFNYLLGWDREARPTGQFFIPFDSVVIASDKRLQSECFAKGKVATPKTYLIENGKEAARMLALESQKEWVLKFPTGCGAAGHKKISTAEQIPLDWPKPFVLQEFIHLDNPEVYRLYGVARDIFGWNARRFPPGVKPSPWVAHARGARYVHLGDAPSSAREQATAALVATGLFDSFGCVDLICDRGQWLVLEVGTDGCFNHVDRDFDNEALGMELNRKLATAFWNRVGDAPWGTFGWKPRMC